MVLILLASPSPADGHEKVDRNKPSKRRNAFEQNEPMENKLSSGLPWLHRFLTAKNVEERARLLKGVESSASKGLEHVKWSAERRQSREIRSRAYLKMRSQRDSAKRTVDPGRQQRAMSQSASQLGL